MTGSIRTFHVSCTLSFSGRFISLNGRIAGTFPCAGRGGRGGGRRRGGGGEVYSLSYYHAWTLSEDSTLASLQCRDGARWVFADQAGIACMGGMRGV